MAQGVEAEGMQQGFCRFRLRLLPGLFLATFWDTEVLEGSKRIFSRCCSSRTARWRSSCSLCSASSSLLLLSSTLDVRHKLHALQAGGALQACAPLHDSWIPQVVHTLWR